jgi:hypothetical protein
MESPEPIGTPKLSAEECPAPTRPGPTPHATASPSLIPVPGQPPIRRFSTSSFSKLSDFHLDSPLDEDVPSPIPSRQDGYSCGPSRRGSSLSLNGERSGVKGVRYVDLSLDAGEWKHPVFKQKVLAILRRLVSTHLDLLILARALVECPQPGSFLHSPSESCRRFDQRGVFPFVQPVPKSDLAKHVPAAHAHNATERP